MDQTGVESVQTLAGPLRRVAGMCDRDGEDVEASRSSRGGLGLLWALGGVALMGVKFGLWC